MKKGKLKEKVQELVIDNKLEEALFTIKQVVQEPDLLNIIIIHISNLNDLKHDELTGIISDEVLSRKTNKLKLGILQLLNKITFENTEASNDHLDVLIAMIADLEIVNNAFEAQSRLRNQLLKALKRRFIKRRFTHYVKIFAQYYDQMSPNEQRIHHTIRGYTKNIIMVYNVKVLEKLLANPKLKKEVPRLKDLERHLIIWKSKYDSIFVDDETISLVYVGVEERVPFPKGIEKDIRQYINIMSDPIVNIRMKNKDDSLTNVVDNKN